LGARGGRLEPVPKPAAGGQLRGAVSPENTSNYFALIPGRCRRSRPYLCSPEKIQRIINAAAELPSIYGFRGLTGLLGIEGSAAALLRAIRVHAQAARRLEIRLARTQPPSAA